MLDFTKSEKRAILVIVIVLIASGLLQLFRPHFNRPPLYDYSESDKVFSRLSKMDNNFFSNANDTVYSDKSEHDKNTKKVQFSNQGKVTENKVQQTLENNSININTASCQELERLPQIGNIIANRIIQYRNKNGVFKNINDLLKVRGIGKKKLDQIRQYLKL